MNCALINTKKAKKFPSVKEKIKGNENCMIYLTFDFIPGKGSESKLTDNPEDTPFDFKIPEGKDDVTSACDKEMEHDIQDLQLPTSSTGVTGALCQNQSAEVWHSLVEELQLFLSRLIK